MQNQRQKGIDFVMPTAVIPYLFLHNIQGQLNPEVFFKALFPLLPLNSQDVIFQTLRN